MQIINKITNDLNTINTGCACQFIVKLDVINNEIEEYEIITKIPQIYSKVDTFYETFERDNILWYKDKEKELPMCSLGISIHKRENIWYVKQDCPSFCESFSCIDLKENDEFSVDGIYLCIVQFNCFSTFNGEGTEYDGDFSIEILKKIKRDE